MVKVVDITQEVDVASGILSLTNRQEENRKGVFFQAALALLKAVLNKLVQNALLSEEMSKEWLAELESMSAQSSKEAWDAALRAMLNEIAQRLKAQLSPEPLKLIKEQLTTILEQIQQLSTLKAKFAAERGVIEQRIAAIEKRTAKMDADLSDIEHSVDTTVELGELEILAGKVVNLREEIIEAHAENDSFVRRVDESLSELSEASRATETSFNAIRESLASTRQLSSPKWMLEDVLAQINIQSELDAGLIYKQRLSTVDTQFSNYLSRIDFALTGIKLKTQHYSPLITSQYTFLNSLNSSAPRPSFSSGRRIQDDDAFSQRSKQQITFVAG